MNPRYFGVPFTPRQLTERREELEKIAMFSGRPNRQTVIGDDDILNLRIALETSTSLEDFLGKTYSI
jgi:hypothetical protein